jgi:hypothetical protein
MEMIDKYVLLMPRRLVSHWIIFGNLIAKMPWSNAKQKRIVEAWYFTWCFPKMILPQWIQKLTANRRPSTSHSHPAIMGPKATRRAILLMAVTTKAMVQSRKNIEPSVHGRE